MFTALQALLNSLAVTFDLPILDWIQAHLQCTFLDVTMPIVTLFGDGGVFWIAVAVVLLLFAGTEKPASPWAWPWCWGCWCATSS